MGLPLSILPLTVAMIDPTLPLIITASVPMLSTIAGIAFLLRRQNVDRADARDREIRIYAETQAKLQVAEGRNLELSQRFEEFKAAAKQDARELCEAMVGRDETIKAQSCKIDELTRQVKTQRSLINAIEAILKQDGITNVRVTAAIVEFKDIAGKASQETDPAAP